MKIATWTDIHFGKKSNSDEHNQDCLDYINWFTDNVKRLGDITHTVFMGDFFENRNAINVSTLNYAYEGMKVINDLGIPTYVIIGNHDLYHRENREVFSTQVFGEFENLHLVSETIKLTDEVLIVPFLFPDEYPGLAQYNNVPFWLGHFEFKNFVITGSDVRMDRGPEHTQFPGPKYIFSGHFHKRQIQDNVVYTGNCFPMDFGDAWDHKRGMCVLDTEAAAYEFIDWEEAPKYFKIKMSSLLDDRKYDFGPKARVKCIVDTDVTYSEAQELKQAISESYKLREFTLEESADKQDALEDGDAGDITHESIDETVIELLRNGLTEMSTIDPDRLVGIYQRI